MLRFKESPTGHSEKDLLNIEAFIDASLPIDFRSMLALSNGGFLDEANDFFALSHSPEKEIFGGGFVLEVIFPLRDPEYPDGELLNNIECYKGRIPSYAIPIGRNAFGDLLLLGVEKPVYGQVFLWDHEREGLAGSIRSHKNVYQIAESFSEFSAGLTVAPNY